MRNRQLIDKEKLSQMYGKRMDHRKVAEIYLKGMPPVVKSLEELDVDEIDFDKVRHQAHNMAGSFSMLCADEITTEARNLESAALERDKSKVRHYCRQLRRYLDTLTRELREIAGKPRFGYGV